MRKSFTWFLSLMFLLSAFAPRAYAQDEGGETQETIELYAEEASQCYGEDNIYEVAISVRDFIKINSFELNLDFDDQVFSFIGASWRHNDLAASTFSALAVPSTPTTASYVELKWTDAATTIGDNVKTEIITLQFAINGFPGINVSSSYSTDLEWSLTKFWYNTVGTTMVEVNTKVNFDGSLDVNVGVDINQLQVEFSTETCAGGDVFMTVTAPEAAKYLFNEGSDPEEWVWVTSPQVLAEPGDQVIVRLMDANGCISLPTKVTVPETIAPVSFEAESHNPSCFGEKGLITIHATGGTAPYTYYVSENADGSGAVTKTHFSFTMAPGTYYVAVQDANECADLEDIGDEEEEGYWQKVEIVDENIEITVTAEASDVQCFGGSDGSVLVEITAEAIPDGEQFWVSLNNGPWKEFELEEGNSYLFEDLAVGEYTAVVKNSAGCEFTAETVEITQPEPITFDMEIVDVSCGGEEDGQIIVSNIVGGTEPYTVVVVEAGTTPELTEDNIAEGDDAVIDGLNPNYHSLTIRDDNGCEVEYANPNGTGNVISVQSPDDIRFDVVVTDPLCNNEDATVTVTNITGGTGSYVILFNGEPNEEAPANVFVWEESYEELTVTVQNDVEEEDNTCAVTYEVPEPANPDVLAAAVRDFFPPTCIEGNDGSIRLDIEGGTEPYEYSINGSSWKPAVFTNNLVNIRVPVGTHEILVRDANGCEIEGAIKVEIDLEVSVITAASYEIIECYGQKEGTISVDFDSWADGLEDGEPVREVQFWVRNPDGTVATFIPSNHATPTTPATKFYAGTYYVWVVDQYTCESNEVKVDVKQNPKLIIDDVVANGASCSGTFEGTINIYAKGGTLGETGLQYAIVNNEGALGNIQPDKWLTFDVVSGTNSSVSTHVDGGTYWIAVRDDGCDEVYYGPVVVDGYAELLVDDEEIKAEDPLCHGDENGTITVPAAAISGGAGGYVFTLYVWEAEDWVAVEEYTEVPFGSFTGLPAGRYYVFVGDAEGCPGYETEDIYLNNPQKLTFDYIYYHFSCYGSNDGIIELYPTGGTDGKYYYAINNPNAWLPFKDQDGSDYYKIYIATEPGTYTIWVKDDNDCTTEPVKITIEQPEPLDAEITITHVKCHGGDDGEITVEGLGGWEGLSAYWFKVDNGSWEGPTTDPITFDGLEAGEHTLYVAQDDDLDEPYQWWTEDCEVAIPFVIEEPDAIEFDVKITNVSCKDGSDGAFTIEWITGGTPWIDGSVNYGYYVNLTGDNYDSGWIWTGGDYSHTFTDLPHSHYSLLIKDANGCELLPPAVPSPTEGPYKTKESWEVQEPATYLTLEAEHINNVSCYGGEDGKFVLHASGGTAPYQYFSGLSVPPADDQHILVPDPEDEGWQESNEFIVGAGTWVIWVMDANGCIVGGEYENGIPVNEWRVQILQPDEIVAELDEWPFYEPACYGNWDGAIGIWVTGGSGEYSFTLTGTSADGQPVELVYNNPDLWDSEGGWDFYVLDGVPASTQAGFDIVVTDSNDCDAATVNVRVTQPEPLSVSLIKSEGSFTCADSNEGWIETSVTGGPEYGDVEYQLLKDGVLHTAWQDISGAFLVQIGHEYTVQVRVIGGSEWETDEPIYCEAEATIDIAPVAEVVIAEIDDRTCYGDETPKAVVTATAEEGRTLELRYQEVLGEGLYGPWSSWVEFNEGEGENTHVITDELTYGDETEFEGHFNFQVKDEEGCESELVFMTFVPVQHPVHADYEIVEETECTATVEITHITGGVAPYVVLVNGEALGEEEAIVLPRGAQVLSIVDAHQCVYEIEVDVVGEYVTREVTIETLYGESVEFTDELAGVEETLEAGEYSYIYVDEDSGCERELIVEVVEIPWPIATVQGEGEESPAVGKVVQVVGTVTGVAEGEGFFMQDANAPWSGIWVPWADAADYEIGDGVAVVGEVDEISSVTSLVAEEVEGVEPPVEVIAIDLGSPEDAKDEQYESVLVKVSGARATAADEGTGEWTIFTEEGNEVVVNDWLYDFAPDAGNFYNVTGIVNTRMEDFKLEPRIEPDIEDLTATAVGPELSTNDFRVYPNPFINEIKIENIEKLTRVVVSNIAGQRVIDIAFPVQEIPTSKLASGVYVVSMFTESGLAKTERIVKR